MLDAGAVDVRGVLGAESACLSPTSCSSTLPMIATTTPRLPISARTARDFLSIALRRRRSITTGVSHAGAPVQRVWAVAASRRG